MDKKKALILLSTVVVAAVIGSMMLNAYPAAAKACTTVNNGDMQGLFGWKGLGFMGWTNSNITVEKPAMHRGWMRGRGYCGFIGVSEEYKENVINIAKSDTDVQNLLNEGYNITGVKPIIKTVVEGDGTIVTKATTAIVTLEKDATGRAMVWVDLKRGKSQK